MNLERVNYGKGVDGPQNNNSDRGCSFNILSIERLESVSSIIDLISICVVSKGFILVYKKKYAREKDTRVNNRIGK